MMQTVLVKSRHISYKRTDFNRSSLNSKFGCHLNLSRPETNNHLANQQEQLYEHDRTY